MDISKHYQNLLERSKEVLTETLADGESEEALTASHNHLLDYDLLLRAVSDRPEVDTINAAVKEYQFALFALTIGQYRHAFIGLRLFFELMLAAIQFSAHEIDYRMWAKDRKDINWNALKDADNGVISRNFINAFNPDFSEHAKQYAAIASTVYRECSEFVHGNASTHTSLPTDLTFKKEATLSWHQKADAMRVVIVFAYAARYLNHIDTENLLLIEPVISDVVGHLQIVQAILNTPVEG